MGCQALRNVPRAKLDLELERIAASQADSETKTKLRNVFHRYFEANIPLKYWFKEMEKDFTGYAGLLEQYKNITKDIKKTYKSGKIFCFAGSYGIGKTLLCTSILKRSVETGFSGLYVSLTDIVNANKSKESFEARKELLNVDFLVIDEFDPRYMATDAASDFYGRVLEDILRNRSQNRMPLFMCTNSPNPSSSFSGAIQQSISSLMNYVELIPALGKDYRQKESLNA